MKKLYQVLLIVCVFLSIGAVLTSCGNITHTHTYETVWSYNDAHHWYACEGDSCSSTSNKAEHIFEGNKCACGYEKATEHIEHTFVDGVCECGEKYVSEGLKYKLNADGKSFAVAGIGDCEDLNVVIPSMVMSASNEMLPVTKIESYAFDKLYTQYHQLAWEPVKSIKIPETVTTIGTRAFYYCGSLTTVTFEENSQLTSIGDDAFAASGITDITLPESVTSIGDSAFNSCQIKSITFPDGITEIGDSAFAFCENLKTVIFGENSIIETMGEKVFHTCRKLTDVTLPKSLLNISSEMLTGCSSLTNIIVPDNVKSIGTKAFSSAGLKSITFGENSQLVSIDDYAFKGCENLNHIAIPSSVTSIGNRAFEACDKLTNITIPINVTTIEDHAFSAFGLTIYCEAESKPNGWFESTSGSWSSGTVYWGINENNFVKLNNLQYILDIDTRTATVTSIVNDLRTVTIPETVSHNGFDYTVTTIGSHAFANCDAMINITIPDTVTTIKYRAFTDCGSLISLSLPNTLLNIGEEAFDGCKNITSITIPETVKNIGAYAFHNTGIRSIKMTSGVETIGTSAFGTSYVPSASVIYCELASAPAGWYSNKDFKWSGNSVVYWGINESNFVEQNNLQFVLDSSTCTAKLTSAVKDTDRIEIPETIVHNGVNYTVTSIASCVFCYFDSLEELTIPITIKEIGEDVFCNCTNLENIRYRGTKAQWNDIEKDYWESGSSVKYISCSDGIVNMS